MKKEYYYKNKGIKWVNEYYFDCNKNTTIIVSYNCDNPDIKYNILIDSDDFDLVKNHIWRVYDQKSKNEYSSSWRISASFSSYNGLNKRTEIEIYQFILNRKFIEDGMIIDHIDRNRFNNKKSNLRIISYSNNSINRIYNNYNYDKHSKKWLVRTKINNKPYNLGRYDTEEEAKIISLKIYLVLDRFGTCSNFDEIIKNENIVLTDEDLNNKYIKKAVDIKNGNYKIDKSKRNKKSKQ